MIYVDKETYNTVNNGETVRVAISTVFEENIYALIAPDGFSTIPQGIRVRDLLYIVDTDVHIFEKGCPMLKIKIPTCLDKNYDDYIGERVLNSRIYGINIRDGHLNVFIEPISKEGYNE